MRIPWNKGTAKTIKYICGYCGKEFNGHPWRISKFCSSTCQHASPNAQKGKSRDPESIRKMVETRKARSNYGWTDIQKLHLSEATKGTPKSEDHKRKIGLSNKGKTVPVEVRKRLSEIKRGILSNSEQHRNIIAEQIESFRREGFLCVRMDSRPHPDFVAIKDDKAYAVEVEGSHMNIGKYTKSPHDYADIIWIRFRRDKNAS
jgi:hypothetical protein